MSTTLTGAFEIHLWEQDDLEGTSFEESLSTQIQSAISAALAERFGLQSKFLDRPSHGDQFHVLVPSTALVFFSLFNNATGWRYHTKSLYEKSAS
jgi:hypothetical protein